VSPAGDIVLVRVYVTESRARLERVLELLRGSEKIRGITVFRGIAGFGGTPITADQVAAPSDPPVVLEFFDHRSAVEDTVRYLTTLVAPHHVVMWPVERVRLH
jgi:PII-like signaling protein